MSALRQTEADALQQTVIEVASCLTRCATRPARYVALRYVLSIILRCIRGAAKKLIGVAADSPHDSSRTAPLTQSRTGPGKVATLPVGPAPLLFYVRVALPAIAAGLELGRQSDAQTLRDSTYIG